jgi:putative protease
LDTIEYSGKQNAGSAFLAYVLGSSNGKVKVEMRNRFKEGDVVEILSPSSSFNKTFTLKTITDEKGESVKDCKFVQQILHIDCPFDLHRGDIIRDIK